MHINSVHFLAQHLDPFIHVTAYTTPIHYRPVYAIEEGY